MSNYPQDLSIDEVDPLEEPDCDACDLSQESMSWSEVAELTHATQVARFNWCACEEQEQFPYDDCPKEGE